MQNPRIVGFSQKFATKGDLKPKGTSNVQNSDKRCTNKHFVNGKMMGTRQINACF